MDSARVLLQASSQDKSYINASFVDVSAKMTFFYLVMVYSVIPTFWSEKTQSFQVIYNLYVNIYFKFLPSRVVVVLFFFCWYTRVAQIDFHIFFWSFIYQDYKQRNAYILTQAPLDNTILDLWQMISQYDIGTVVMLNNLKEGKQVRLWHVSKKRKATRLTLSNGEVIQLT